MPIATRGSIATIDLSFDWPFRVMFPPVYRYLQSSYIDSFINDGTLRLSSLQQFRAYADEARGDGTEGQSFVHARGGGRTFGAGLREGNRSYILCGSFILRKEIMDKFGGCDGAFEISNIVGFAAAVGRQLRGLVSGTSGYCIYTDSRSLVREMAEDPFPLPAEGEDITIDQVINATAAASQNEHQFLKDNSYSYQAEYRFIWNVDHEVDDHIFIQSKEAARFCRKVSPGEIV